MRVCVQMLPTAFSISLLRALPFAQGVWVLGRWCLSPAAAEQQARGSHLGTWLCGQSRLELEAGWPVCAHDRRRLGRGVGALAPLAFLVFCPCPTTILLLRNSQYRNCRIPSKQFNVLWIFFSLYSSKHLALRPMSCVGSVDVKVL
jgi:hypothetical protein